MTNPTCTIVDCEKPTRSAAAVWCKMHYHRWYRHGDPLRVSTGISTRSNATEYQRTNAPGHPIAGPSGKTYVHRLTLFGIIGLGPHACYWCAKPLHWNLRKGHPNKLTVDHLNDRRDDNRDSNLAPACNDCNGARGSQRRSAELAKRGWWSHHDTIDRLTSGGRTTQVELRKAG